MTTTSITNVVPANGNVALPMRKMAVREVPIPSAAIATSNPQLEVITNAVLAGP